MREKLLSLLETTLENINVKATTTEKLGFAGREEGIALTGSGFIEKDKPIDLDCDIDN